jgi:predicted anti-sigma-YlaC factor YlaD
MTRQDEGQSVERLLGPTEEQVTCEQCFDLLDEYVELDLRGDAQEARLHGMRAHLDGCPACQEDYESLRALARTDV